MPSVRGTSRNFRARNAKRRSNRHFLGRAVCSVGETNNTQDSTPGLSEFGKVSQHLHCTLAADLPFARGEPGEISRSQKNARVYIRARELPFYGADSRGWGNATFWKNNTADFRPRRGTALFRETTATVSYNSAVRAPHALMRLSHYITAFICFIFSPLLEDNSRNLPEGDDNIVKLLRMSVA